MNRVEQIITDLSGRKRSISCNGKGGLLLIMDELGFYSKEGKTQGHKVFVHEALNNSDIGFTTHSIDCGHAPKRPMKFPYVVQTISLIRKYDTHLQEYLDRKELK